MLISKSHCIKFNNLVYNYQDFLNLNQYQENSPLHLGALFILGLIAFIHNEEQGEKIINQLFLKPLTSQDFAKIKDVLVKQPYLPNSYFDQAAITNGYTINDQLSITVYENEYSFPNDHQAKLYIKSSGAESMRPIKAIKQDDQWFLQQQYLLNPIEEPQ